MLRWLVRRVVKYVVEELNSSEDFKWLMHRYSRGTAESGVSADSGASSRKVLSAVEVDSMKDLAAAMTAGTSEVEIGIKNESETVSTNKERNADTLRRLSEIGG